MVVICDNKMNSNQTTMDPPNPPDSSTSRPPIGEASEALPAYTPNPSPHSFTPIEPVLLISVIFSVALCIATLVLSLFDGGRASAFLNLFCPIPILFHHTLLLMDEVKLDHTQRFMGQGKIFTGRGDLSRWLFFGSLSSAAGSIIAFTNVGWWGGTVPAQAIVQFIQVLTLWYILWRAFAMRNPTQGVPIILSNGSTVMIRFSNLLGRRS
ncbi:hypothetical protein Moror_14175 [Moniliophthora roreri MCA 2997]|uniref:Uncharacterized protein n=1 Tax=Moniliophthora roreri (strain MCA 2997) TaxID=1381753 RepID=V2XM18_MONRO|nr:hypothetical protein Moror_14175 [Moniliophthora roreri MCA 2997]